jgi:hypothetical protein
MRLYGAAEIAVARGDFEGALTVIEPVLAILEQFGVALNVTDFLLIKAQAQIGLGRWDEASLTLNQAREIAEGSNARRTLWHIYDLLSQLETQRGNKAQAAHWHGLALDVIRFILDHAGMDDIRQAFLADRKVQRIVGANIS